MENVTQQWVFKTPEFVQNELWCHLKDLLLVDKVFVHYWDTWVSCVCKETWGDEVEWLLFDSYVKRNLNHVLETTKLRFTHDLPHLNKMIVESLKDKHNQLFNYFTQFTDISKIDYVTITTTQGTGLVVVEYTLPLTGDNTIATYGNSASYVEVR